jgi:hypothetical protein
VKLCVLGDSHAAALKTGWATIAAQHPGIEIAFYAAPGQMMADLTAADGALVAGAELAQFLEKIGASGRIGGDCDRYLVHALYFSPLHTVVLDNRNPEPAEPHFLVDATAKKLRESLAAETVTKLRQITHAPITMTPMPCRILAKQPRVQLHDVRLAAAFDQAANRVMAELGVVYLRQPEETRDGAFSTKAEYARDAQRFKGSDDDGAHMNAAYGAIVMREWLRSLGIAG